MSTLLGTYSNAKFGCVAESGILVTSVNINATSDKVEVRDGDGDVALVSYYNQRATISVAGTVTGTTGINAATIGNALTIANLDSVGGVSAGVCLVDSVGIAKKNNGFTDISVSATRYPNITSSLSGSTTVTGGA